MPIRVKHTVVVKASRDTDFKQVMWNPDTTLSEVVIDGFDKQTNGNLSIAASASESLPMGDVDAVKGMFLEVSAACNVRLNGGTDNIVLTPNPASGAVAKFFIEAVISAVVVENLSASVALTGVYVFWGDPTT